MATMQRHDGLVQSTTGAVIPGASVQVNVLSSGAPATIYQDEVPNAKTNPITTGSDGSFFFYAADDDYTIAATYGGTTYTLGDVTLHSPPGWRQFVAKTASVAMNADNALKDDEELEFDMLAGEMWEFTFILSVTTAAAADFQYEIDTTPGASGTGQHAHHAYTAAAVFAQADFCDFGTVYGTIFAGVAAAGQPMFIHGYVTASANCVVHFRWAPTNVDASDTEVNIGSYVSARKVSLS